MDNFRYLESVINATGGSEEDIKARTVATWKKWHDLTAVLCDQRIPVALTGKIY